MFHCGSRSNRRERVACLRWELGKRLRHGIPLRRPSASASHASRAICGTGSHLRHFRRRRHPRCSVSHLLTLDNRRRTRATAFHLLRPCGVFILDVRVPDLARSLKLSAWMILLTRRLFGSRTRGWRRWSDPAARIEAGVRLESARRPTGCRQGRSDSACRRLARRRPGGPPMARIDRSCTRGRNGRPMVHDHLHEPAGSGAFCATGHLGDPKNSPVAFPGWATRIIDVGFGFLPLGGLQG
jgi:hypothetical protein